MPDEDDRHESAPPIDGVAELVAGARADARPLREIIALLTEGPHTLASLIRTTTVSRRGVERLLDALGDDLVDDQRGLRINPGATGAYRERFGYEQLRRTRLDDPLAARLSEHQHLVDDLAGLIVAAPESRRDLDHVSATPETAVRRALWLDATYDLAGAHLLCVGDHDLTALAVAQVNPAVRMTVVDVDERILAFIDEQARRRGLDVRCWYADLRFGLPIAAAGAADLVFTDPPYSPEGVQLFLARGLAGLRDRGHGALVTSYGFGESQPGLGLKVQRAVQDLHLAYEAILPGFNRYTGAQAVGSASDLYVLRPTARTWKSFDGTERGPNIYTHGAQSLEGESGAPEPAITDALWHAASDGTRLPVRAVVAESWQPVEAGTTHLRLATALSAGLPRALARHGDFGVAVDLRADPGSWLLRVLLAVNAERVAVLVDNAHPDLATETAQHDLAGILRAKYTLRFRRSSPDSQHALVAASAVPPSAGAPSGDLTRRLLERAPGKLGNVWREALAKAEGLTKNEARARIHDAATDPGSLDSPLLDIPRHRLAGLLSDVARSAGRG